MPTFECYSKKLHSASLRRSKSHVPLFRTIAILTTQPSAIRNIEGLLLSFHIVVIASTMMMIIVDIIIQAIVIVQSMNVVRVFDVWMVLLCRCHHHRRHHHHYLIIIVVSPYGIHGSAPSDWDAL